jgi:radical SAM-linked protein
VDERSDPVPAAPPEPRQRWRLLVARLAEAPRLTQRETIDAWESAVETSGLPVARSAAPAPDAPGRPKVAFGAPLATGMIADGERLDVILTERLPRWRVREALGPVLPDGWSLVDLEDVWLGGVALGGIVAAADYRIDLDGTSPADAAAIGDACRSLLAAPRLPRHRDKGGEQVAYDLRPLVVDVGVADVDGRDGPVAIRVRTRFHQTLGTGRPEEVVGELGDRLGRPLTAARTIRERVLLADELD